MAEAVKEEPADFDENAGLVQPEYYSITDVTEEDEDSKCDINLDEISSTDTDEKVDVKHDSEYYQQFLDKEPWDAGEGTSKQPDSNKTSGLVESIKEEFDSDNSDMEAENDDETEDSKSLFEEQLHELQDSNTNAASDEDGQKRSNEATDESESETCGDHTYASHKSQLHRCRLCDYKHRKPANLKRHIDEMHQNMKEIKCKHCRYRTFKMLEMESHVSEQHPEETNHKCGVCDETFICEYNLLRHMKFAHRLRRRKCQFCDHHEDSVIKLRRHIQTQHIKNKICQYCGYSASQRSDMIKHITRMHIGIKRHKCKSCTYAAVFERDLKNHHDRIHVQVRCDVCDFTSDKKSVMNHKLSAHNSIPVKIPKQKKAVKLPSTVYKCIHCSFESGESVEYGRHVSSHFNEGVIRCKICDFRAESRYLLNKHIKRDHQGCIEQ